MPAGRRRGGGEIGACLRYNNLYGHIGSLSPRRTAACARRDRAHRGRVAGERAHDHPFRTRGAPGTGFSAATRRAHQGRVALRDTRSARTGTGAVRRSYAYRLSGLERPGGARVAREEARFGRGAQPARARRVRAARRIGDVPLPQLHVPVAQARVDRRLDRAGERLRARAAQRRVGRPARIAARPLLGVAARPGGRGRGRASVDVGPERARRRDPGRAGALRRPRPRDRRIDDRSAAVPLSQATPEPRAVERGGVASERRAEHRLHLPLLRARARRHGLPERAPRRADRPAARPPLCARRVGRADARRPVRDARRESVHLVPREGVLPVPQGRHQPAREAARAGLPGLPEPRRVASRRRPRRRAPDCPRRDRRGGGEYDRGAGESRGRRRVRGAGVCLRCGRTRCGRTRCGRNRWGRPRARSARQVPRAGGQAARLLGSQPEGPLRVSRSSRALPGAFGPAHRQRRGPRDS